MTAAQLTPEELATLTGYKRGADQARWLQQRYGLHIERNAAGVPVVTWAAINAAIAGQVSKAPQINRPRFSLPA